VVLLGVWLAGHDWTRKTTVRETAALITPSACRVVVTEPLGAAKVVATGSFAAVTSISSQSAVTQVATMSGEFHYIDDDRLLALAGPGAAMLVRTSRDTAELVFLESTALPSVPPRN
jgi:hypothetical protein